VASKNLLAGAVLRERVVVVVELVDRELALPPQLSDRCRRSLLHAALKDVRVGVEGSGDLSARLEVERVDERHVPFTRVPAYERVPVQVRENLVAPLL